MSSIPRRRISRCIGASCLAATLSFSTGATIAVASGPAPARMAAVAQDDSGGGDQSGSNQGGGDQSGSNQGGGDQSGSNQGGGDQSWSNQGGGDQSGSNQGGGDQSGSNQGGGDQPWSNQGGGQSSNTQSQTNDQPGGSHQSNSVQGGQSLCEQGNDSSHGCLPAAQAPKNQNTQQTQTNLGGQHQSWSRKHHKGNGLLDPDAKDALVKCVKVIVNDTIPTPQGQTDLGVKTKGKHAKGKGIKIKGGGTAYYVLKCFQASAKPVS